MPLRLGKIVQNQYWTLFINLHQSKPGTYGLETNMFSEPWSWPKMPQNVHKTFKYQMFNNCQKTWKAYYRSTKWKTNMEQNYIDPFEWKHGPGFPSKQVHTPFQPMVESDARGIVEPPRLPVRSDLYIDYSLHNNLVSRNQWHLSKFERERKLCIA